MTDGSITAVFNQLENDLPQKLSFELTRFAQDDAFLHLAALQDRRRAALRAYFAQRGLTRVILGGYIDAFDAQLPGCTVEYLEKRFFADPDQAVRARKRDFLEGAVVIMNNIAVGRDRAEFVDFHARCDRTIFVMWDMDNHHWHKLSPFLAAHGDVYAPGNHENLYTLTRYNWATVGPVYCATIQWSRRFLTDNLDRMITADRSNAPLGRHAWYADFPHRNRVVSTLSRHYPSIGFTEGNFHGRTPQERLEEWCSHKLHWIAPVLNDVPIRIFDALITGGIPIVPASMRFLPPIRDIDRAHILFSTPDDLLDPRPLVERGNAMFDAGGADGIVTRHRYALENHHGDQRIAQLMDIVRELFA